MFTLWQWWGFGQQDCWCFKQDDVCEVPGKWWVCSKYSGNMVQATNPLHLCPSWSPQLVLTSSCLLPKLSSERVHCREQKGSPQVKLSGLGTSVPVEAGFLACTGATGRPSAWAPVLPHCGLAELLDHFSKQPPQKVIANEKLLPLSQTPSLWVWFFWCHKP